MPRCFVDSNIFLRFYNADEPEQGEIAARLFKKASEGEVDLYCGPPVFFEVAWVLSSRYKYSLETVLNVLSSMLSVPNMTVFDRELVINAIEESRKTRMLFADSYIATTAAQENLEVATFNKKHFEKFGIPLTNLEALAND